MWSNIHLGERLYATVPPIGIPCAAKERKEHAFTPPLQKSAGCGSGFALCADRGSRFGGGF
ncbi:MAG: hypothetical protein O9353_13610, partial [Bacteroidia bacterium]|nr:hypothetical protein [Bacteroidia bacterium]